MDCVDGAKGSKSALLVLTERKTRHELLFLLDDKKASSVVSCIDYLNRLYGSSFGSVFKSLTVDNGREFSDHDGIEYDDSGKRRTNLYYCHPYCPSERGSNENQNRLVRRFFPKGFNFRNTTKQAVAVVQKWINDYPRKLFGYRSSGEIFNQYMQLVEQGLPT